MPDVRRLFGTEVEKQVAARLVGQGYAVLEHQFKTRFGEIDLVCRDGDEVVFVEVKARTSHAFGYPEESVHTQKLRKIVACAELYLQKMDVDQPWRIDVIAVETDSPFTITHIKGVDIPDMF